MDYKIIAIGISDEELCHAINQRKYISETETIDEVANNYALEKFMQLHGPTHAITFHSSVKKAKEFQARHIEFHQETTAFHVNGQLTTNERNIRIKEFERSPKAVMTNARCLTEGVDVPAIDIVYFCDPKNSKIDIVQAAGRTLRRADYKGKQFGYIVVPIFHQDKNNLEEVINDSPFKNLINIIGALCSQDERLVDELKQIKLGNGQRNVATTHIAIEDFCNLITIEGFHEHLKNNLFFQGIGNIRIPWKLFTDAKAFVHSLNLKTGNDWFIYCKSGNKPDDIPVKPHQVYKNKGWVSMGDWLGTGSVACQNRIYQSLNNATQFVHQLNLKTINDWLIYCKSGDKPDDIPANPVIVYKNKGWISWGDWLGTGVISNQNKIYRSFEDAREFTRQLRLKSSSEWKQYCKSGNKPDDIPTSPLQTYSDKGWISWGDWLGTGVIANQKRRYLPFDQARTYIHDLGLKNRREWKAYALSEKRPNNIPTYPDHVYKENGWISLSDWLGKSEPYQNRVYWPYDKAKQFVHALGIKTYSEWQVYCKSGNKPEEIPAYPRNIYRNNGWISTGDWLGTGVIANQNKECLLFEDARYFVHRLGLKSLKDWTIYSESGKKPDNIPKHPRATYKHKGWKSIKDWVGIEIINFLSFNEARIFVHQLDFKSESDWRIYCKSGKKPNDIPATPSTVYKNKGWKSMSDWLGTKI